MSCQPRGTKRKNDRKYYNLCNELNYLRVLIGSFIITYDILEGRCIYDITNNNLCFFNIKQIHFMSPWVCSVITQRRSQIVAKTSVTHSAASCVLLFLFSPHYDVFSDLLLNKRTATWNLSDRLINMVLGQVL